MFKIFGAIKLILMIEKYKRDLRKKGYSKEQIDKEVSDLFDKLEDYASGKEPLNPMIYGFDDIKVVEDLEDFDKEDTDK